MTRIKFHYSWVICFSCMIFMFCGSGMIMNAFSVYMPYLREAYGLTDTQTSYIPMIRSGFSILFKFCVIWLIHKLGIKKTMALGTVFLALAFVCYSVGGSAIFVYVAAALSGVGYGLCTMVPISILLNHWFNEKLSFAVAISAASTGVASMILPTIITYVAENYSLALAFRGEAVLLLAACLPSVLLIKATPEEVGLQPYGVKNETATVIDDSKAFLTGFSKHIFHIVPFLLGAVCTTVTSLFSLHFTGQGYTSEQAALSISVFGFTLLIGKFAYGIFQEKIGSMGTDILFMGLNLLASAAGCLVSMSSVFMYICTIFFGLGGAMTSVGITMWARSFSSPQQYDKTIRMYQVCFMLGNVVMSPITGSLADYTGSYTISFFLFGVITAIMLIIILYSYHIIKEQSTAA